MRTGPAVGLVVAMGLVFGGFAVAGALPISGAVLGTGAAAGGAALALVLRRWMDRSVARSLARAGPPGGESARLALSSYTPYRSWSVIGTVTTTAAYNGKRFDMHDVKRRMGLRLLKRVGFGHRLDVGDEEFSRDVYVEYNPEIGAKLFASAECREAARAIFGMGFFAIEYRHGLVVASRHGKVPDNVAEEVRPHLLVLAANTGVVAHERGQV